MICRVALHENPPGPITSDEATSFRAWLKEQQGSSVVTMRRTHRRGEWCPSQYGTQRIVWRHSGIAHRQAGPWGS